jgi:hypothetical protein
VSHLSRSSVGRRTWTVRRDIPRLRTASRPRPWCHIGCLRFSTIVDSDFDIFRHIRSPASCSPMDSIVCLVRQAILLWQAYCEVHIRYNRCMFKISIADTASQRTLIVEGTLVGPWVPELRTTWRNADQELDGRQLVIDLSNLTVISHEGEDAIFDLMKRGAKFSHGGVLIKHVLRQLARRQQQESLRR